MTWLHEPAILRHSRPVAREREGSHEQIRLFSWECRLFFWLKTTHHQAQVGVLKVCDVLLSDCNRPEHEVKKLPWQVSSRLVHVSGQSLAAGSSPSWGHGQGANGDNEWTGLAVDAQTSR